MNNLLVIKFGGSLLQNEDTFSSSICLFILREAMDKAAELKIGFDGE